jgi:ferredoxin
MNSPRRIVQAVSLIALVVAVFRLGQDVERWCPFGAVESAYAWVKTGSPICAITYTNLYAFIALIVAILLFKRAFCGYICPLGTIGDWSGSLGRFRMNRPLFRLPRWLDTTLSMGKYVVLALVLWFTWQAGDLVIRGVDPCYALVTSDRNDVTLWAYGVLFAIAAASFFIKIPFCRWVCPLAAVMNPISRFGLARIRRNADSCVDCGKCASACPMSIRVDKCDTVTASRCTLCQECVNACPLPEQPALSVKATGRRGLPRWALPVALAAIVSGLAMASHLWPLMTFHWQRGHQPDRVETLDLRVRGLTCSGSGLRMVWFLERDDLFAIPGFLKLEAIPSKDWAQVRIEYDPAATDREAIIEAVTFPYSNVEDFSETHSPFVIEGELLPPPEK